VKPQSQSSFNHNHKELPVAQGTDPSNGRASRKRRCRFDSCRSGFGLA
jgi:hypothetical protein